MTKSPVMFDSTVTVRRKTVASGSITYGVAEPYRARVRTMTAAQLRERGLDISDRRVRILFLVDPQLNEGDRIEFTDKSGEQWYTIADWAQVRCSYPSYACEGQQFPAGNGEFPA